MSLTVRALKEILDTYSDDAVVIAVDWSNGKTYDVTVGGDDEDEGIAYCRLGID